MTSQTLQSSFAHSVQQSIKIFVEHLSDEDMSKEFVQRVTDIFALSDIFI